MAKFITAFLLSAILLVGSFAVMGMTTQTASAKDSECKVEADKNTCVITAKKGDIEVDKLNLEINVQGGESFNSTGLEEQINNLEDAIEEVQNQVNEIENSTGITSIEIAEGEADTGNGNGSNGNETNGNGNNNTDGNGQ